MDTTITGIGAVVVAGLRSAGYMESTIGQYEKSIKALSVYARRRGTSIYTPELGAGFASLTTSPRTGRFSAQRRFDYRRLVAVFDSYVATGRVDLSVRRRGGGGPKPAGDQFVALDVSWEADMVDRGLAVATREAYGRVARGYLCFLESSGIFDLDAADGGTVLSFLASLSPRWAKTSLFGWSRTPAVSGLHRPCRLPALRDHRFATSMGPPGARVEHAGRSAGGSSGRHRIGAPPVRSVSVQGVGRAGARGVVGGKPQVSQVLLCAGQRWARSRAAWPALASWVVAWETVGPGSVELSDWTRSASCSAFSQRPSWLTSCGRPSTSRTSSPTSW